MKYFLLQLASKEMAFEFFETSAKTGKNVQQVFERLAYHITDICNPQLVSIYRFDTVFHVRLSSSC